MTAVADIGGRKASPARFKLIVTGCLALVGVVVLTALGVWQLERRVWKLNLIDQVERRVHAAPEAAPGPALWPRINADNDAFRRVSVTGHFLDAPQTLVRAITERGAGFWVLAPFRARDGFTVLINRGFVPADAAAQDFRGLRDGEITLTGLLRITESGGGFLRYNDPSNDHWYSRDVGAIATARGIEVAAPYFIDADASGNPSALPVGGLTVIAFPNNHLVYALTWFGLAAMLAGWLFYLIRLEWRHSPV